ncbi:MAG: hypothetical protein KDJ77_14815, partial [Rhodobiaceae bacterium]|nr:hypothetical protein [Rhodobiaceae bacterium]
AMKYAPPEGGAPLIFETLKAVISHPDLNAAHAVDWNKNFTDLDISADTVWIAPEKATLAPGDLAVLSGSSATALAIETVDRDEDAGLATLGFNPSTGIKPDLWQAILHTEPEGVRTGLPRTVSSQLVVKLAGASSIPVNTVVEVRFNNGASTTRAVVVGTKGDQLILTVGGTVTGKVTVEAYTPFAANGAGDFETPTDVGALYFRPSGSSTNVITQSTYKTRDEDDNYDGVGKPVARSFAKPSGAIGLGFANLVGNRVFDGSVVAATPPSGISIAGGPVRFAGKPPKGLAEGDWYVSRPVGGTSLAAHKVTGLRVESDVHYVYFSPQPTGEPDETEFFGPMTRELRPQFHDRNPADAIVGGDCTLEGLSADARDLLRPGKAVIVVRDRDGQKTGALATIVEREEKAQGQLRISLDSETDFTGWEKGWTTLHCNTVAISHGESKDPKTLGSGDAEKRRQDFRFKVDTVSFIPSTASINGVAPDMDVAVDGIKWEYRDLGDPDAEGSDAWSVRLNEDDTLQILFRRRLPTGTNNVTVPRHRVGVGLKGTGVPAFSFDKPMKKNRFVDAIVQPFATSGGSDREPVSDMRENAPANLAANGRAVALKDFERLAQRHSSVWQARAREIVGPGSVNHVDVIIVPAGGGAVSTKLEEDLIAFLADRALPGVEITIADYEDVMVDVTVTARVDTARYDKTDVQDALAAALAATFALSERGLGEPFYVAEILAAGEDVAGVENLVVDAFARAAGAPQPLREAVISGSLAAVFA